MSYHFPQLFQEIETLLRSNPSLHLHEVVRKLGVERHSIEKAVRRAKAISFRKYRKELLLHSVIRRLKAEPASVKEIAVSLGYESPSSVWRLVKSSTGESPTMIRTPHGTRPASK